MKRANGEGYIRKRKNGLWEGQYTAGIAENGKPIKKSVYGKTQKEVAQKITSLTNDLNTGLYITPDKITVGEWFNTWEKDYLIDVKQSTVNQYDYQFRVHIKPELGNIKLQKLTGAMIQGFYGRVQKPHKIKQENGKEFECKGLSPKSLKNLHGVLHKCLDQAIKAGYIRSNPCDACTLPSVIKKEMRTVTDVSKFLEIIKGDEYENLYILAVFSGMRQGEILGLTKDCVDYDNKIITVEKQLRRDHAMAGSQYGFSTPKNGKKRIISPAQFVFDALKRENKKQIENKLKNGSAFSNENNLVFTNEIGGHLSDVTVRNHLQKLFQANGVEGIRFHDLRHSFATISLENGEDIKTVSENLGHATVAFTMDTYAHVTEAMKKRSGDRMQEYINSLNGIRKGG